MSEAPSCIFSRRPDVIAPAASSSRRRLLRLATLVLTFGGPLPVAEPQQPTKRFRILELNPGAPQEQQLVFREALRELGYVQGQNIVIEDRFAGGSQDRLREYAAEAAHLRIDVIVAISSAAIRAATNATKTIPIVGVDLESDPVARGFIASIARPGGNLTGIFVDLPELTGKGLELLKEAIPRISRVAIFRDPALSPELLAAAERAAPSLRLPTVSFFPHYTEAGLLMSYGPNLYGLFSQAATYVDRILKGTKPGDLPVQRPARFEMLVNSRTAKALGLIIPQPLLLRADRVID